MKVYEHQLVLPQPIVTVTAGCADTTTPGTVGAILCNVKDQALVGILIFIYAASLLIGSGLIVLGIFKLKQLKKTLLKSQYQHQIFCMVQCYSLYQMFSLRSDKQYLAVQIVV